MKNVHHDDSCINDDVNAFIILKGLDGSLERIICVISLLSMLFFFSEYYQFFRLLYMQSSGETGEKLLNCMRMPIMQCGRYLFLTLQVSDLLT